MSIRLEIEIIRDRSLAALNASHDYFTYTRDAWRSLQQDVQRQNRLLIWKNLSTGSYITEKDVAARAQGYIEVELATSTLQQFVSIFESFLTDVVRTWLAAYPAQLSGRQLSAKDIIALPDKAAIINAIIEKELKDIFYDRPASWFDYLRKMVNIKAPTVGEAEQLAEIKATRDVLVHGQGTVNEYYVDKAGTLARAALGSPLEVPGPYHQASWDLISKLVKDIGSELAAKA